MELFKLEPGLAIWTWIAFGILFFLLWKFVIPALLGSIEKREEYIASSVDKAEMIDRRLKEIEEERSEILANAGKEADAFLLKTRGEAEVLRKSLVNRAEEEAAEILARARTEADREREAIIRALREDLTDFVCDASEKVAGSAFITERERELSRELVKAL